MAFDDKYDSIVIAIIADLAKTAAVFALTVLVRCLRRFLCPKLKEFEEKHSNKTNDETITDEELFE